MTNIAPSLLLGVVAILLVFGGLYRFSPLRAVSVAILVGLGALGIYVPLAILDWPGTDVFVIHVAFYGMAAIGLGLIVSARERTRRDEPLAEGETPRPRAAWAPAVIIGFFVLIAGVNAVLLTVASEGLGPRLAEVVLPEPRGSDSVSSIFPGVVSHDFHEKEAQYNAYLEQRRAQEQRGWRVRKGWAAKPVTGQPARFKLEVTDAAGEPIRGASVAGTFLRPSDQRRDRTFEMSEVTPGLYEVALVLDAPGRWDMVLTVTHGEAIHEVRAYTWLAESKVGEVETAAR